jgi:hypothetical protein
LENRTLWLSPEIPGFYYQYDICVSDFLGICTKHERRKETFDLRDEKVRRQLLDMGFVAKVRERVER